MIIVPIGNTVLFLNNSEKDALQNELVETIRSVELQGSLTVEIPDLLSLTVTEARTLLRELNGEETVNWKRDGF